MRSFFCLAWVREAACLTSYYAERGSGSAEGLPPGSWKSGSPPPGLGPGAGQEVSAEAPEGLTQILNGFLWEENV